MNIPLQKFALALCLAAGAAASPAATITIACGSTSNELEVCKKHADAWARRTGNEVKTFSPPANPTEALALYRQLLGARSTDVDIILIDAVWPGVLKDHLLDLKAYTKGAENEHYPAIIQNNTVNGRLVGMPWYVDAGLLYYRKDLLAKHGLSVPLTWAELGAGAKKIQAAERAAGVKDFHGFVFQAKAYEGLTCNALEWVASWGGGTIVEPDGTISINNAGAAGALNMAAGWIGSIAPIGVLNYGEEDTRGVFQNGQALYMRNWPYAWALLNAPDSPVNGKVGVAALPRGEGAGAKSAATLGGWQLAVNRYSPNAEAAVDLLLYMTGPVVQKDRAIKGSFNPTRPALYGDADIARANPFMANLREVFANAVARPSTVTGLKYPSVSQSFWDATHDVLSKEAQGEDATRRLEGKLRLIRRGQW
ncbi:ABC transporter substrate-binding protein [Rivibacter subsaxonicus]|uniref:Carbohydrate ABC transporter substrate-binding protein (CUT1 family) n=1 Tax=Rivibacter subsaxonicus TaxID=457575 RepID=A0A4Q7VYY3_9BURK|nr:ABC transporter substrate-binding protein [Rivibacter subsaxonicus]RZU01991.1 carbohydrate ABC transporter substrate-binding protein (CUT1 family) [Rivibacter subsaxonicus]